MDVEIGAKDQNRIYNFWISGHLSDNHIIKIFDVNAYDLREYINKEVDLLIIANLIVLLEENASDFNVDSKVFNGKFLGEYRFPQEWIKFGNFGYINRCLKKQWYALEYGDGIFLLDPQDLQEYSLRRGENIVIDVGRFDLVAWRRD